MAFSLIIKINKQTTTRAFFRRTNHFYGVNDELERVICDLYSVVYEAA